MRPEIYADLPKEARRGMEVMRISMQYLPPDGHLLTAMGNFLNIAERQKLTVFKDPYGNVTIHVPPTESELESALSDAKEIWDRDKGLYEAAGISGTEPEDYTRHRIRNWAAKENLPLPWEK